MRKLNIQCLIETVLYILFATALLALIISDRYLSYVTPRMKPYLYFAVVVLFLFGIFSFFRLFQFAYKMKLDAMKRQGSRTDLTLCQSGTKSRTDQLLGEQVGESARSVQRYIRLTELIPELLDLVDNKKLQFTVAVDISYIDKEVQEWIYEYISDTGFIKPKQIAALRNQLNDGPINQIQMLSIFNNCVMAKKVSRSLTFSEKKLTKYFPDDYTAKDMEQVIESLLEKWMQEQSC